MNIHDFKAKWRRASRTERSAAQEHFLDLCEALGVPKPGDVDPSGVFYTFEKGLDKAGGGRGFADVWLKDHFAWEYKGPGRDLDAAYKQLLMYHDDLDNPPLLVVCDLDRIEIHTKWTGTPTTVFRFSLEDIDEPDNLKALRALWTDPEALKPKRTVDDVTKEAAEKFGSLALRLAERGEDPERVAHFLVQILFCLFAEDVGLLRDKLFSRLLQFAAGRPADFPAQIERLFRAMRDGGHFDLTPVERFNGGLFEVIDVVELDAGQIGMLLDASRLDWASIEPAIIGTLFERSLDPARRSQLGAHYTGRADIERVVEPVVMTPLRRRWAEARAEAERAKASWERAIERQRERLSQRPTQRRAQPLAAQQLREAREFERILTDFQEELTQVRILDPACGSGNFLYVALNKLLDLEKEVIAYGTANGLALMFPRVRPSQLYGLEINRYAQELTQVVIWIGYLQWMTAHLFQPRRDPVLGDMDNIRLQDALLDRSDPYNPKEAEWPEADYIIGNPPFLGGKRIRSELGDDYIADLFKVYDDRLPHFSDLCCYFFERAREQIDSGESTRAGLLATNSIRGGANRVVLDRIKDSGDIFMAWDDEEWILDGAAVRISIIGFDDGDEAIKQLDGTPVTEITSALTSGADLSQAKRLAENGGIGFIGDQPTGPFDVTAQQAREWMTLPLNPNGRPNSDVLRPYWSGSDVTGRWSERWIVDFGVGTPESEAALYEAPFEYVRATVKPARATNRNAQLRERWWLHWRPRPEMRDAIKRTCQGRFLCTPHVSKYRVFKWLDATVLPNNLLIVFARDDDYFFGVLHSRAHEVWSLRMGTWLGKGNDPRYTPTTTFETFPFPRPDAGQREAIAEAARRLNELRERWLNPEDASEAELKRRTLTNLYNQRPSWLAQAHDALDRAIWAAYGWEEAPGETEDETILRRLLALNLERAGE